MVDIIIRAKDGHDLTRACIGSIKRNTPAGTYRIILVDDGSKPSLAPMDYDLYVRHAEPRGAVSATNSGLALALQMDGDHVLVLDNDTRVPGGDVDWLERFVREIDEHDDCAAAGATTNYANPPQHILAVPQTYTADWEKGTKENTPVIWFISCAVLLKKDAIRQVGLWDERYNPGNWEDTDYALQLRKAGWTIRVARSVYIHHVGHQTFSTDLKRLLAENKGKFLKKWGVGAAWDMGMLNDQDMAAVLRQKAGR